jgi:hypothetical protein
MEYAHASPVSRCLAHMAGLYSRITLTKYQRDLNESRAPFSSLVVEIFPVAEVPESGLRRALIDHK